MQCLGSHHWIPGEREDPPAPQLTYIPFSCQGELAPGCQQQLVITVLCLRTCPTLSIHPMVTLPVSCSSLSLRVMGKKKKKQTKNQQHNTKTRHLLEVEALKYNHLKMIIYFQKKFWNRLVRAFGTDSGKFPRQQPFMEQACIRMRVGCLPKP